MAIPKGCKRLAEVDFQIVDVPQHAARIDLNEVTKVAHYYLAVNAVMKPMQVREETPPYGGKS